MFKVLRALFFIFVLLVIIVCTGIWWVSNNANDTIKTQIEIQGTKALGANVTVGAVDLNVRGAGIQIKRLKIANLPGYAKEDILSAEKIAVSVEPRSLFDKLVNVKNVTIEGANVYVELKDNRTNIQDLMDKFKSNSNSSSASDGNEESDAFEDVRIRLTEFKFKNGNMNLSSKEYGSATVPAPYISLSNIGGDEGLPLDQFTDALLEPFISQLKASGRQLIRDELEVRLMHKLEAERIRAEAKLKEKSKQLKKKYEAEAKEKEDQLKDKLKEKEDELKNQLEDKLKNLF